MRMTSCLYGSLGPGPPLLFLVAAFVVVLLVLLLVVVRSVQVLVAAHADLLLVGAVVVPVDLEMESLRLVASTQHCLA